MTSVMPASDVLDREFLEIRAKILELAASFDRMQRGDGAVESDDRFQLLQQGLHIVQEKEQGRAERVQLLFSLPFESNWREEYGI